MAILLKSPLIIETDEDLERVGRENAGYRFERDEDGTIVARPTYSNGGAKSAQALVQLDDSNTGFAIGPRVRIFCPDASWVSAERIAALSGSERSRFWPISPDVIVEVRSQTDSFQETVAKSDVFIGQGTTYAVAIDPFTREVVTRGVPPPGSTLDIDAITDA